jgi:cytochrome b
MTITDNTHEAGRTERPAEVKVWDIAVRLFHWSLISAFAIAWLSADEWDQLHEVAGYMVGGLIAFRLIWGVIGSKYARFSDFVYKPSTITKYMRDIWFNKTKRYLGHNPAGGAMIIALLLALAAVTASGIAMTLDMFWGMEWVEEIHEASANLTLLLAALHVAGVIYSSIAHRENLVRSMITGFKRRLSE